jgi:hypothetical protein
MTTMVGIELMEDSDVIEVCEMLRNAADNGYALSTLSDTALAVDLCDCCADAERIGYDRVLRAVTYIRLSGNFG